MKIAKQYFWIIKRIWGDAKGLFCLYICITLVGMVIPTIVSFLQKLFVTSLENASPFWLIIVFLTTYVAIKFLNTIYQYIDSYFAHRFIYKVNFIFNTFLTKLLYKEPQQSFYDPSFNDRMYNITKGQGIIPFQVFSINEIISLIIVISFVQIPLIVNYSPILIVLIALNSIFSLFVIRKFAKAHYVLEQELVRKQRKADYFGGIFSSKANAKEIRIFTAQGFFLKKWLENYKSLNITRSAFEIKKQKIQMLLSIWDFLINSVLLLAILFIQLIYRQIDLGSFILLYTIVPVTCGQVKTLLQAFMGDIYNNYLHIQHYVEYVNNEYVDECIEKFEDADNFQMLELRNVSYIYPTGVQQAVKNVSLSIQKGEVVSILGYNGSGKTTLSKLLTGVLSPSQGNIYINGEEVNKSNKHKFSYIWGLAYQDFTKYLLSIENNIGYGYIEKYNEDNINKASQEANCDALLAKLPKGLKSLIGKIFYDDGIDLSGGEWQKIVLARAYMGEHSILILDEPTAAIDPLKEMEMLLHFKDILSDRTAILISHRIGFARLADRIIIMDKGEIVESGTHDELMQLNGLYKKLFDSQKELYI